ncbi:MAG: DUF262 domain-containing protein [Bacteroidales bacterium]|nr:DUF262 domain-containing protein [Bacteroidales bacterium]
MELTNNAFLKDENILTLFSLNNLIIPEIQREYVWGKNTKVLEKFLNDLKESACVCNSCHHVHGNQNINIGFLYSYKPPYVKLENERYLDEYLIDGQQRITTIFLLLLVRAVVENRVEDFCNIVRYDENEKHMSFSYKVRNLTQDFLLRLVEHIVKNPSINSLDFFLSDEYPFWFLADYYQDPTIASMTCSIKSMLKIFPCEEYYFDYLLESIHFWHFKTEATSQGEELYISMNSRGEQLSSHETQKATSLPPEEQINWGKKWENWQTFFWKNRNNNNAKNFNADKGFNQYLDCIDSLERFKYELSSGNAITEDSLGSFHTDIKDIEIYMEALSYICDKKKFNLDAYSYKDWYDSFLSDIWEELNINESSWKVSKNTYNNDAVAKNKAMLFWSWMYYYKLKRTDNIDSSNIDSSEMLRLIHFYYIRYHCYKRSARPLFRIIEDIAKNGFNIYKQLNGNNEEIDDQDKEGETDSRLFSNEEVVLSKIFNLNTSSAFALESICWKLQDIPYLKDGKKVGGNTINDFLDYIGNDNEQTALKEMETLYSDLNYLISNDDNFNKVKSLLLFYSEDYGCPFWQRQSPYYYYNYECSLKKRIVRCEAFLDFYKEYRESRDLDQMLKEKRKDFFSLNHVFDFNEEVVHSLKNMAIIYDAIITRNPDLVQIWNKDSVAFSNSLVEEDVESGQYLYRNQMKLWSLKRYFGSNFIEIKLPKGWRQLLIDSYPDISFKFKNYDNSR